MRCGQWAVKISGGGGDFLMSFCETADRFQEQKHVLSPVELGHLNLSERMNLINITS
jgi:hypothetical protein